MFKQQRCWAHMIREADTLALRTEDDKAKEPAPSLKLLYHDIKAELKGAPTSKPLAVQESNKQVQVGKEKAQI